MEKNITSKKVLDMTQSYQLSVDASPLIKCESLFPELVKNGELFFILI